MLVSPHRRRLRRLPAPSRLRRTSRLRRNSVVILTRLAIVVCVAAIAAAAPRALIAQSQGQTAQASPKPANIDRNGVLILIRSALIALDQGNKTGNYTVLRDLGAPGFQT